MTDIEQYKAETENFDSEIKKDITSTNNIKRKSFDSMSTNSSSGDNQGGIDSRFEARQVPDIQVKKSFLTGSNRGLQNGSCSSNSKNSLSTICTEKNVSLLTSSQVIYTVSIAIKNPELDQYGCMTFKSLPGVEIVLEDDVTVESVITQIVEKLNVKLCQEVAQRSKTNKKPAFVLSTKNNKFYEISETNKKGAPKGCSFDRNQILHSIGCKPQISLKIIDPSAFDPVLLKLFPKQKKPLNFDVNPIPEHEDEVLSIVRNISHYKDSLIQKEMSGNLIHRNSSDSSNQKSPPSLSKQSSGSTNKSSFSSQGQSSNKESIPDPMLSSSKKYSFWDRIFSCGVICQ